MLTSSPVPVRELTFDEYPGVPRFARDYVSGSGTARSFLAPGRVDPGTVALQRDAVAAGLLRTNRAWGNEADEAIGRWQSGEAEALIAGQQTGLGGGPLYTLTKIASLIRLRERCRRDGVPVVVMFWMATEDHDYLEAANLLVSTHRTNQRIHPAERPDPRHIVGTLPVPLSARRELLKMFPDAADSWLRPGISFGDSFATLLALALRGHEVILVDSLLPELRTAGAPLFEQIVRCWDQVLAAVDERSGSLTAAGYNPQIASEEGHALLWKVSPDGLRLPIRRRSGAFTIGDDSAEPEDLHRLVTESPGCVSTGALTRPLLQDLIFRPRAFVGGPAEVSYYAQCAALHELLGVPLPEVMLRGHVLIAPERILRTMEKHGFTLPELFEDPDDVLARHSSDEVRAWKDAVAEAAEGLGASVQAAISGVAEAPSQMRRSVRRSMARIRYHLDRMAARGARALARRDADRAAALDRARMVLAPGGVPQDRTAGWLPWFAMYGDLLMQTLVERVEPGSAHVAVIGIGTTPEDSADEF